MRPASCKVRAASCTLTTGSGNVVSLKGVFVSAKTDTSEFQTDPEPMVEEYIDKRGPCRGDHGQDRPKFCGHATCSIHTAGARSLRWRPLVILYTVQERHALILLTNIHCTDRVHASCFTSYIHRNHKLGRTHRRFFIKRKLSCMRIEVQ